MSDEMVQEKREMAATPPENGHNEALSSDGATAEPLTPLVAADTTAEELAPTPTGAFSAATDMPAPEVAPPDELTAETPADTPSTAEAASSTEGSSAGVTDTPAPAPEPAVPVAAPAASAEPVSEEDSHAADADMFAQAMQSMGDQYDRSLRQLHEGDVIDGIVMRVDRREGVLVDVGAKSEGIIRLNELSRDPNAAIEDVVSVGEKIRVYVLEAENQDGNPILSKKRADFEQAWERVLHAKETGETIHAMVQDRVKGGLVVDLGIRGFVPASHVGSGSLKNNLDRYVGQSIALKVIEVDKDRRKVVLSNKMAEQETRAQRSAETRASLDVGQIRPGVVRRLTNYGAFIDLGGIDGLLHISEMSWTRINDPKEVLREGQELDVIILKLDLDNNRVSLGLRQILPDPWQEIPNRYKDGDVISGQVTRLVPFGAFVQVEGGVEGIIPNSELPRRGGAKGNAGVAIGDTVEVKIIGLKPDERKMTLSMRALQPVEEAAPREPREPREAREGGGGTGGGGGGGRRGRGGRGGDRDEDEGYSRYVADEPRFTIGDALGEALVEQQKRKERERRRAQREQQEQEEDFSYDDLAEEAITDTDGEPEAEAATTETVEVETAEAETAAGEADGSEEEPSA